MCAVNDVNDNAPIFGRISYSFTVLENTDQLVGVGVTATDIDLGTNSDIIFSIIGGNEDYTFVIGSTNNSILIIKSHSWLGNILSSVEMQG